MRQGLNGEQALTEGQESGAPAISQEPERRVSTVGIILPTESNLVMLASHEAMVGDGYVMGIAAEIAEYMMRTAEGWLGVDDPVLPEQGRKREWKAFSTCRGRCD